MNLKRFGIVEIDKLWRSAGVRDAHGGGLVHEVEGVDGVESRDLTQYSGRKERELIKSTHTFNS